MKKVCIIDDKIHDVCNDVLFRFIGWCPKCGDLFEGYYIDETNPATALAYKSLGLLDNGYVSKIIKKGGKVKRVTITCPYCGKQTKFRFNH